MGNFWRSWEMPLNSCKVELSVNWIERCILTIANNAVFKMTDAKLYVSVISLSTEDNAKLPKLLSGGFNRSIFWNKCNVIDNTIVEIAAANRWKHIREMFDSGF